MTINVAIFPPETMKWYGGVEYFCNLISAVKNDLNFYLFLTHKIDPQVYNIYKDLSVNIIGGVQNPSIGKRIHRIVRLNKIFGLTQKLETMISDHNIDIISHSNLYAKNVPTIYWVPDLQHKHYPEYFTAKEKFIREVSIRVAAKKSSSLIVSSNFGREDLLLKYPKLNKPVEVLQFCSMHGVNKEIKKECTENYFVMSNQYWKHKNHFICVEAIKILRDSGIDVKLYFTGGSSHTSNIMFNLKKYIDDNNLSNDIIFTGFISTEELIALIGRSVALINPSLFEGWNTSVELAKNLNTQLILSDIPVHREQCKNSFFFDPRKSQALADGMKIALARTQNPYVAPYEKRANFFKKRYIEIVEKSLARCGL